MAICPFANVRLIDTKYLSGRSMAVYNRVNFHVAAGTGSLFNFFNASGRASSHFWISYTGVIEQYVDTKLQAEADLDGNDATVSIETEGGTGSTADSDPWTSAQVDALVRLSQWIMDTHGIMKVQASSSKTDDSSKGQSWHRLGIDGNFPALPDIRAGRGQRGGGMHYSTSGGKVCPGGGKIQQIPGIVARITGSTPPPLPPNPPPNGSIDVDGFWGSGTTTKAQQVLGLPNVDGEVWYQYPANAQKAFTTGWVYNWVKGTAGSPLVREIQRRLGITQDGVWGSATTNAFEVHYGYPADGRLDGPSNTVKRFQDALNRGTF